MRGAPRDLTAILATIARHKGEKPAILRALGMTRCAVESKLDRAGLSFADECARAKFGSVKAEVDTEAKQRHETDVAVLRRRLKTLERDLAEAKGQNLTDEMVRRTILGLADQRPQIPDWLVKTAPAKSPGVPTLLLGDWHWGERVDPTQIGGVNRYNLSIARDRARTLVTSTIDLLEHHVVRPEYPGIVLAFAGDMLSGDIHDELTATNEAPLMPAMLDLFGVLVWCIDTLSERFGNVFIPWVRGNHTRTSKKPRAKDAAFTSYDWLLGQFLARHYEKNSRIRFHIPSAVDALFSVFGTKYLLTHGDHLGKGGDGLIGCLGPLARGNHKRSSRAAQIAMPYDFLLCGHYHTTLWLQRLISTGTLKGFDEYAFRDGFGFEEPQQSLWLTHPRHGPTIKMQVRLERGGTKPSSSWVEWSEAA